MDLDANTIMDIMANRSSTRIATSDKEVAILIAENEQLRKENEALKEENKLLRGDSEETKK